MIESDAIHSKFEDKADFSAVTCRTQTTGSNKDAPGPRCIHHLLEE